MSKQKPTNEKPISLHPLTVEEALRKAMVVPLDNEPKPAKPKKRKKARKK